MGTVPVWCCRGYSTVWPVGRSVMAAAAAASTGSLQKFAFIISERSTPDLQLPLERDTMSHTQKPLMTFLRDWMDPLCMYLLHAACRCSCGWVRIPLSVSWDPQKRKKMHLDWRRFIEARDWGREGGGSTKSLGFGQTQLDSVWRLHTGRSEGCEPFFMH